MKQENITDKNIDKKCGDIKCPEVVPEEQIGATEEERKWVLNKEPRPPVPRFIFAAIGVFVLLAFVLGGAWYYRTNVLPEKYHQRATALLEHSNYEEACVYYLKVLKLRPERKDILYQIAFCLENTGKIDEAIERYEEHLKVMPADTRAMGRLAWLYIKKGEYEKALVILKEAAKKDKKNPVVWDMMSLAALKANDTESAGYAFARLAETEKDADKILNAGRELMRLRSFEDAHSAFLRCLEVKSSDKSALHGLIAAKSMLGYPTDVKFIIKPGVSIGPISIGYTKDQVKEALGHPDVKEFIKTESELIAADKPTEVWTYSKNLQKRGLRIMFAKDTVKEIETASSFYMTEKGLGLSNFLLSKNAGKFESRKETGDGSVVCSLKGGGLTFYAYGMNSASTDARYKKLRLHKGSSSAEGAWKLNLTDLFN